METDEPRALQVVSVDVEKSQVSIVEENVQKLSTNLRMVIDSDKKELVVWAVMGAYRTGKSFLLDLILKYLRYRKKIKQDEMKEEEPGNTNHTGRRSSSSSRWLEEVVEGRVDGKVDDGGVVGGFGWRGGMEKCTEGIWIWSEPFELDNGKILLLVDTQGAWDSRMTKSESSTIFGLTAAISSYLVYNVSMQIQEDKVENLHYFLECAAAALRRLEGRTSSDDESNNKDMMKPFEHLEFLVRDWAHFDEAWGIEEKEKQMKEHLKQHFDSSVVKESAAASSISSMYEQVSCFLLPHPGLVIQKANWQGNVGDLSEDFIKMVEYYISSRIGEEECDFGSGGIKGVCSMRSKAVLGKHVTPASFPEILRNFVQAFKGLIPDAGNLAQAVARSSNLLCKESALVDFRSRISSQIRDSPQGLKAEEFNGSVREVRDAVLKDFDLSTAFGPEDERTKVKEELLKEIDFVTHQFEEDNKRKTERALTMFSGLLVLIIILYLIDKSSDITCDWYSDTCVRISSFLFACYFTLLSIVMVHAFFLYRDRGQMIVVMALMEMGKSTIKLASEYVTEIRTAFSRFRQVGSVDLSLIKHFVHRFLSDCLEGLSPVITMGKRKIFPQVAIVQTPHNNERQKHDNPPSRKDKEVMDIDQN